METEVTSRKENPLLGRVEVTFRVVHTDEPTPTREAVRDELAQLLKAPKERIILDHLRSEFGRSVSVGMAKVYEKVETALEVEPEHLLVRNTLQAAEAKPAAKKPEEEE
jgi:small subunit ribosomal protein S24e